MCTLFVSFGWNNKSHSVDLFLMIIIFMMITSSWQSLFCWQYKRRSPVISYQRKRDSPISPLHVWTTFLWHIIILLVFHCRFSVQNGACFSHHWTNFLLLYKQSTEIQLHYSNLCTLLLMNLCFSVQLILHLLVSLDSIMTSWSIYTIAMNCIEKKPILRMFLHTYIKWLCHAIFQGMMLDQGNSHIKVIGMLIVNSQLKPKRYQNLI